MAQAAQKLGQGCMGYLPPPAGGIAMDCPMTADNQAKQPKSRRA